VLQGVGARRSKGQRLAGPDEHVLRLASPLTHSAVEIGPRYRCFKCYRQHHGAFALVGALSRLLCRVEQYLDVSVVACRTPRRIKVCIDSHTHHRYLQRPCIYLSCLCPITLHARQGPTLPQWPVPGQDIADSPSPAGSGSSSNAAKGQRGWHVEVTRMSLNHECSADVSTPRPAKDGPELWKLRKQAL